MQWNAQSGPGGGLREGCGERWGCRPGQQPPQCYPGACRETSQQFQRPSGARGGGGGGGLRGGAGGAGHLETAGGRALIGRAAASAFQPGAPPPAPSTPEGISSSGGRYCCPSSLFGSDRVTIVSKLCPCGAPAGDPRAPTPDHPPLFFFFLQSSYHDFIGLGGAGEGDGMGRGRARGGGGGSGAGSWPAPDGPYFGMVSIRIFKKSCFVGSGLLHPPASHETVGRNSNGAFPLLSPQSPAQHRCSLTSRLRAGRWGAFAAGVVPRNAPRRKVRVPDPSLTSCA